MSCTYDANKNMTAEDMGGVMDRYGTDLVQDNKDRMTSWTRDATTTSLDAQSWSLSFENDWDDTTVTDAGTGVTEARTHNSVHELLTIDPDNDPNTANALTISHDSKGNLSNDGSGRAFTHDFDNMLSQVTVSPGASQGTAGTHSYAYDALNRRVSKTVNGTTTVFVCSGSQVLAEYTAGTVASSPDRKYVYGVYIDEPIALIDSIGPSEKTYYYHRNRQYSIIGLSDENGVVVERYAYTAYGDPTLLAPDGVTIRVTSSYGNAYLHTGRRFDHESGLYYYRARYYSPTTGRFLERDPLGYPDGLNTYAAYHILHGGLDPMGLEELDIVVVPRIKKKVQDDQAIAESTRRILKAKFEKKDHVLNDYEIVSIDNAKDFNEKLKKECGEKDCVRNLEIVSHGGYGWITMGPPGGEGDLVGRVPNIISENDENIPKGAYANMEFFDNIRYCEPCTITLRACFACGGGEQGLYKFAQRLANRTGCTVRGFKGGIYPGHDNDLPGYQDPDNPGKPHPTSPGPDVSVKPEKPDAKAKP